MTQKHTRVAGKTVLIVWKLQETKQKQTNNKRTSYQSKANINRENQKHQTWTQNKTKTKNKQQKSNASWFWKKGMLGKFVSNKQANINKGKAKLKKDRRNPPKYVFQKGVDGQKQRKIWTFEREDTRRTRRKQNRKKRRILKPFGGTKEEEPLKLKENSPFWPFPKREQKQREKQNHQKIKKTNKNKKTNKKTPFTKKTKKKLIKTKNKKKTPFWMLTNNPQFS